MTRRTVALALVVALLLGQLPLTVAGEDVVNSGSAPVDGPTPVIDDETNVIDVTDDERITDSAVEDDGVAVDDENTTVEEDEVPTLDGDGDTEIPLETESVAISSDTESTAVYDDENVSFSVPTAGETHVLESTVSVDATIEPGTSTHLVAVHDSHNLLSTSVGVRTDADATSAEVAAHQNPKGPHEGDSPSTESGGYPVPVTPAPAKSIVFVGVASAVGFAGNRVFTPHSFTHLRGLMRARTLPSVDRFWDWGGRLLGLFGVHDHEDPLDNETRATVYDHLVATPGTYLSEISEATALPLGTVRYHLKVLRAEGYVTRTEIRGRPRFVPVGEELSALEAALAEDASAAVLRELARDGADSVSGLADRLDRDPSTVSYHLDKLESAELVERERTGQAVENRLTPAAAAALSEKPTATAELAVVDAD